MNTEPEKKIKWKTFFILAVCFNLVYCASSQKKPKKARENDPQFQYNLGLFYLNKGKADEAIKCLNKSLETKPGNPHALNALGLAHFMKGNFSESVRYYQQCLALDLTFTEARNNMGSAYQEMELFDKAEEEFQKAIADENYHSRELPYYNLARLYLLKGQIPEALGHLQRALEINNKMVLAYNLRGTIYEELGKYGEAVRNYSQALQITPGDINLSFNLAKAYFKNSEFVKAQELFEKIYAKATDPSMKTEIAQYLDRIRKSREPSMFLLSMPPGISSALL